MAKAKGYDTSKTMQLPPPPEWAAAPYEQSEVLEMPLPEQEEEKVEHWNIFPPGRVGDFARKILEEHNNIHPHEAIFVAQAAIGIAMQDKFTTNTDLPISGIFLIVGASGGGKNLLVRLCEGLVNATNVDAVQPWPASATALGKGIQLFKSMAYIDDELLKKINKIRKQTFDDIEAKILKLFSITDTDTYQGQQAAQKDYCYEPTQGAVYSLFGGGTVKSWSVTSQDAEFMESGWNTRLEVLRLGSYIDVNKNTKYTTNFTEEGPFSDLVRDLKNIRDNFQTRFPGNRYSVQMSEDAYQAYIDFKNHCGRREKDENQMNLSISRLAEIAMRMATRIAVGNVEVLASGRIADNPKVDLELMEWSIESVKNRFAIFKETSLENHSDEAKFIESAFKFIKSKGRASRSQITNAYPGKIINDAKRREYLLEEAVDSGPLCRTGVYYHFPKQESVLQFPKTSDPLI
jgi:hypothetical protein